MKSLQNFFNFATRFVDPSDVGKDDICHVGQYVPVLQLNSVYSALFSRFLFLSFN